MKLIKNLLFVIPGLLLISSLSFAKDSIIECRTGEQWTQHFTITILADGSLLAKSPKAQLIATDNHSSSFDLKLSTVKKSSGYLTWKLRTKAPGRKGLVDVTGTIEIEKRTLLNGAVVMGSNGRISLNGTEKTFNPGLSSYYPLRDCVGIL